MDIVLCSRIQLRSACSFRNPVYFQYQHAVQYPIPSFHRSLAPRKPEGLLVLTAYGQSFDSQADNYISDQELAH